MESFTSYHKRDCCGMMEARTPPWLFCQHETRDTGNIADAASIGLRFPEGQEAEHGGRFLCVRQSATAHVSTV